MFPSFEGEMIFLRRKGKWHLTPVKYQDNGRQILREEWGYNSAFRGLRPYEGACGADRE